MGFLANLFSKKGEDSVKFRREMAQKIAKQRIRYVTEKKNDIEEVIGKDGAFSIRDGQFIVFASSDVLFRTNVDDLRAWELLSGEGAVLTGPDLDRGGEERTVTAFYVYYR